MATKTKQIDKNTFFRTNKELGFCVAVQFPHGNIVQDHVKIATAKMGRTEKKFSHKKGREILLDKLTTGKYCVLPFSTVAGNATSKDAEIIFDEFATLANFLQ
jgi:hypothetical protein